MKRGRRENAEKKREGRLYSSKEVWLDGGVQGEAP